MPVDSKQLEIVKKWMRDHKSDKRAKPDKLADAWKYAKKVAPVKKSVKAGKKRKLVNGNSYKME